MLSRPDFDYLFFLDSDVVAPPDTVTRLIKTGHPIVSGVYCRRSPPQGLPVMQAGGDWVRELPDKGKDPIIEVDVVGAGCLLIHRSILENLPPQRRHKPWFDWRADMAGIPDSPPPLSEDFAFCLHARAHGHRIMVDTSIRCKHIGLAESDYHSMEPLIT